MKHRRLNPGGIPALLPRQYFTLAVTLVLMAGPCSPRLHGAETDSVKSVLVLLTGQPGLIASTRFLNGLRTTLLADSTLNVDVSAEHISLSPFPTRGKREALVRFLGEKFRARRFDMAVLWGQDPVEFLLENRPMTWSWTSAIACLMYGPDSSATLPPGVVPMIVDYDYRGTVAIMRRLHPGVQHIALVGGFSAEDRRNLQLARRAIRDEFGQIDIIEPIGRTPREGMQGLAGLPDRTVVLLTTILADAGGRPVVGGDWVPLGIRHSNSPAYCIFSHLVGTGAVGGSVTDFQEIGAEVARNVLHALKGEPMAGVGLKHQTVATPEFDWRALQKWGIEESLLPPGSVVRYRPVTLWNEYRWQILGTFGILLILVLSTTGLAVERKYRKEAQKGLEEKLRKEAERLKIESFVAELSLPLIKASPEELSGEIVKCLYQLIELLGFDRGMYADLSPDSNSLKILASAGKPGVETTTPGAVLVFPWASQRLRAGQPVIFDDKVADLPVHAKEEREYVLAAGLHSAMMIPLEEASGSLGVLSFGAVNTNVVWSSDFVNRLTIIGRVFSGIIADKRSDEHIRRALEEVTSLKQKLEAENVYLREAAGTQPMPAEIAAKSAAMKTILAGVERVAPTDATVLIMGETGTGKEVLARAIHRLSKRRDKPMVTLNCAALPPSLFEAELFGREKGAYTGALSRQAGRFELADGSTIFLDEIGDITLDLQVKLLRVLEHGELQRVGGTQPIRVDVRLIAATNRDLVAAVRAGTFREDLFYRLNVFPISVPPLRERRDDIPLLAWMFAKELGQALGKPVERISQDTMESLQRYPWPGNIRELRNVIERALILGDSSTLHVSLPAIPSEPRTADETLEEAERKMILDALERSRWRIRGNGGAAEILGLKPSTLEHRMKRLDIKRPQ
jgi:formate hydrogenlyase transcriptional activator